MDVNSAPFEQFMDYRMNQQLQRFVAEWKELGIIDQPQSTSIRANIQETFERRRQGYLNEMRRTIDSAFRFAASEGEHPDHELWAILHGNF